MYLKPNLNTGSYPQMITFTDAIQHEVFGQISSLKIWLIIDETIRSHNCVV